MHTLNNIAHALTKLRLLFATEYSIITDLLLISKLQTNMDGADELSKRQAAALKRLKARFGKVGYSQ